MKTVSRSSEKYRKELTLLLSREQAATAAANVVIYEKMKCIVVCSIYYRHYTPKWAQHRRKRLRQTKT